MTQMSDVLLETKDLVKYFPVRGGFFNRVTANVFAVDGVNLRLRRGETLGLVGESGCGKSTLGKALLQLFPVTRGSIMFQGKDVTNLDKGSLRSLRKEMQMIFQDPFSSLNPRMRIFDILAEPFRIHKRLSKEQLRTEVSQLLELVGLTRSAAERFPHEFSGGQRQRVGIARSIALKPRLIVADEPVSALDVSIQSQILNLLVELKRELQLSYLFIAHDLAVVEHISDRVAVMYLGKIVEHTSAELLYTEPLHPYTQALIAAIPIPDPDRTKRHEVVGGDVPNPMKPPSGCAFHTRCPGATDRCKVEEPRLRNLGSEDLPHWVACHYA